MTREEINDRSTLCNPRKQNKSINLKISSSPTHDEISDERSRPEYHVERKWDMKVERIVVEYVYREEHQHQVEVVRERNHVTLLTQVHFVDETFDRHHQELGGKMGNDNKDHHQ